MRTGIMRFVPKGGDGSKVAIGEPVDESLDVGMALYEGKKVEVRVFSGTSVLDAGKATESVVEVERALAPLTQDEIGSIRCIGLNVRCSLHQVAW